MSRAVVGIQEIVAIPEYEAHFGRTCLEGASALENAVGYYVSLLKMFGADEPTPDTREALRSLAVELHPDSKAAREIAAEPVENPAPSSTSAPPETAPALTEAAPAPTDEYTADIDPEGDILDYPEGDSKKIAAAYPTPLEEYVLDRLGEDDELEALFDEACRPGRKQDMVEVAHRLYREVIPEASPAARRNREHRARRSELEERLFPKTRIGEHLDEILAALARVTIRERTDTIRAVCYRLEEIRAGLGARVRWGGYEYAVETVASDEAFVSLVWESSAEEQQEEVFVAVVAQFMFDSARRLGYGGTLDEFSDHVWSLRRELFPDAPGAGFSIWLNGLDLMTVTYLEENGLDDALTGDQRAGYVGRAFDLICEGDRAAARLEYRRLIVAARKAFREASKTPA